MKIFSNLKKGLIDFLAGGTWSESFITSMSNDLTPLERRELLDEYKNLTYACIKIIADEVSKYQPIFFSDKEKTKVIKNHPLYELIEQPNENTTQNDFFRAYASYKELQGECLLYFPIGAVTAKPKEILILRPDLIDIELNDDGTIKQYVYRKSPDNRINLTTSEIILAKDFNPLNPYRGLGTVQAGILYLKTENTSSEFQYHFLDNQAVPSGLMTLKNQMSQEAFQKFKDEFKEKYSGTKNSGKTLVIRNSDVEYTKLGLSLADLDLDSLKSITSDSVRMMFRVPKPLLGDTDSSGLGRANVEAVDYIFSKNCIEPKLKDLDNVMTAINNKFYKGKIYVGHISQIPSDKEFELKKQKELVDILKTRNEIRAENGLSEVEGGDKLFVGFNQMPLGSEQPEEDKDKGKQKLGIATIKDKCTCNSDSLSKKKRLIVKTDKWSKYFIALDNLEDTVATKQYRPKMRSYLLRQKKEVLEILEKEIGKKENLINITEEAFENVTAALGNKGKIQIIVDTLLGILFNAYKESGVLGLEFLGLPDVKFIAEQQARDSIFSSTDRLVRSFNEDTAQLIQKQIAGGLMAGEKLDEITKRIESIYSEARGYRAERIAQTESHRAVNFGTAESYRQAGVVQMQWKVNPDACEFCRAMDGKVVDIGKPFINNGGSIEGADGGEFMVDYDDVSYADLHPNCKCRLEPVKK